MAAISTSTSNESGWETGDGVANGAEGATSSGISRAHVCRLPASANDGEEATRKENGGGERAKASAGRAAGASGTSSDRDVCPCPDLRGLLSPSCLCCGPSDRL